MKSLGLSTILALSLPFAALAGHINQHFNRHQEVARRAPAEVQLQKRFDSARWSYYETQTGNALVFAPTPLSFLLKRTPFPVGHADNSFPIAIS
jgi:hypothetical protein